MPTKHPAQPEGPAAPPAEETGATPPALALEVGWCAAWRHLRLAVLALYIPLHAWLHPLLAHLPRVGWGTRLYLLANVGLYGLATAAFLFPSPGLSIVHMGLSFVDGPLPHAVWGLSALAVCLLQIAALLSTRWSVWRTCAMLTAMWASAWAVVILLMAHTAGVYGGAIVWLWILILHYIVIANRFVPAHDPLTTRYDVQVHMPSAASDEEEQSLVDRWQRLLSLAETTDYERAMLSAAAPLSH